MRVKPKGRHQLLSKTASHDDLKNPDYCKDIGEIYIESVEDIRLFNSMLEPTSVSRMVIGTALDIDDLDLDKIERICSTNAEIILYNNLVLTDEVKSELAAADNVKSKLAVLRNWKNSQNYSSESDAESLEVKIEKSPSPDNRSVNSDLRSEDSDSFSIGVRTPPRTVKNVTNDRLMDKVHPFAATDLLKHLRDVESLSRKDFDEKFYVSDASELTTDSDNRVNTGNKDKQIASMMHAQSLSDSNFMPLGDDSGVGINAEEFREAHANFTRSNALKNKPETGVYQENNSRQLHKTTTKKNQGQKSVHSRLNAGQTPHPVTSTKETIRTPDIKFSPAPALEGTQPPIANISSQKNRHNVHSIGKSEVENSSLSSSGSESEGENKEYHSPKIKKFEKEREETPNSNRKKQTERFKLKLRKNNNAETKPIRSYKEIGQVVNTVKDAWNAKTRKAYTCSGNNKDQYTVFDNQKEVMTVNSDTAKVSRAWADSHKNYLEQANLILDFLGIPRNEEPQFPKDIDISEQDRNTQLGIAVREVFEERKKAYNKNFEVEDDSAITVTRFKKN